MEDCHRNVLRQCKPFIRKNISVDEDLLCVMTAKGILSDEDELCIWKNQSGIPREPQKRVDELLTLLPRRGYSAFEVFIAGLKNSLTKVNKELAVYLLQKVSEEKQGSRAGAGASPSACLANGEDEVDSTVTAVAPTTQANIKSMGLSAEADTSQPTPPGAAVAAHHPATPAGVAVTRGNTAPTAWPVQAQRTAGGTVTGTASSDPAVATAGLGQTAASQVPHGDVQNGQSGGDSVNPWTHTKFPRVVPVLVKKLTTPGIVLECWAQGLIKSFQRDELDCILNKRTAAKMLIGYLEAGSRKSFKTFCEIIEKVEPDCNVGGILKTMRELL